MNRPITTLFMLSSVDGKISTGATDELDVDRDFPAIRGVGEGLHQYYEIEQTTEILHSLGFDWPEPDMEYLKRLIGYLNKFNY